MSNIAGNIEIELFNKRAEIAFLITNWYVFLLF